MPRIIAYVTSSVDGRIAPEKGVLRLSSDNDIRRLHEWRSRVDAVMVGANTVVRDNPLLTVRLPGYTGPQPWRIIVDSRLITPPQARVYDARIAPSILVTSAENIGDPRLDEYAGRGVEIVFAPHRGEWLDLASALREIEEKYGINSILVEGGGILIGTLLVQGLIDKLIVSIAPLVLGRRAVPLVNIDLREPVKICLEKVDVDRITGEVLLYYVLRRSDDVRRSK